MSIYINNKTGNAVERKAPTEGEYVYDGKPMILETDEKRNVTYANKRFVEVSGYSKEEIIGAPHCMHMHPDMPAVIFENACKMNDEGKTWHGLVQNITKEGVSYWTEMLIQPKFNDMGKILGYMATRREMDPSQLNEVKEEYTKLLAEGSQSVQSQFCGELYLGDGGCKF